MGERKTISFKAPQDLRERLEKFQKMRGHSDRTSAMLEVSDRGLATYGLESEERHRTTLAFWCHSIAVVLLIMSAIAVGASFVSGLTTSLAAFNLAIISWVLLYVETIEPKVSLRLAEIYHNEKSRNGGRL